MLIQNADRSFSGGRNPNILFNGNQFLIYDHELSFSFVSLIGTPPEPWQLRGNDFVTGHIFYQEMLSLARRNRISFDDHLDKIGTIPQFLEVIIENIPEDWKSETILAKITPHFKKIGANITLFGQGLMEALV